MKTTTDASDIPSMLPRATAKFRPPNKETKAMASPADDVVSAIRRKSVAMKACSTQILNCLGRRHLKSPHQFASSRNANFLHNTCAVHINCLRADIQRATDFLAAHTRDNAIKYFMFAG